MNEPTTQPALPASTGLAQIIRTFHLCVDIHGVLRWSDSDLSKLFTEDGTRKPGRYVRDWLRLQLAQGKKVLPMGKPCEGFSYQTGCPGHEVPPNSEGSDRMPATHAPEVKP